jgi:ketosteroid isomerase-like protein
MSENPFGGGGAGGFGALGGDPLGALPTAEELGREFFAALDARDPRRLRATLADYASFRALAHKDPVRPAEEILAYFGSVVSSYPTARWEVTDVIGTGDRACVQFVVREYDPAHGRERISEQVAIVRAAAGKIIGIVGYYDSAEFHRVFWDEG